MANAGAPPHPRIVRVINRDALNDRAALTARLVRQRRRAGLSVARRVLPRQQTPTLVWKEYAAAITRLMMPAARDALAPLMSALPKLLENAARERARAFHADAGEGSEIRKLVAEARERMSETITVDDLERLARKFADRTATFNKAQLSQQIHAALGTDVFIADRRLRPLTDAFVDANVGLIKDIGDKLAGDIEQATMRAIQAGTLHGDLATELEGRFGIAENRAKLIARDQVGKAYGQINAARQRELGVERFIWRTVSDDRVRDEHDERDGETYDYSDPPAGELPGEPINCRCYAEPVFEDILDEADDGTTPAEEEPAPAPKPEPVPEPTPAGPAPEPEAPVPVPEPEPPALPKPDKFLPTMQVESFNTYRQEFTAKLELEEKKGFLTYSGHEYSSINAILRGNEPHGKYEKTIADIDRGFAKYRAPYDMKVLRGSASGPFLDGLKVGDVYVDKAYVSTTIDRDIGENFGGGEVVFQIHVPRGAYVAPIPSHYEEEREFLLPRNTKMRVLEIEKRDGKTHYHVILEP